MSRFRIHPTKFAGVGAPPTPDLSIVIGEILVESAEQARWVVLVPSLEAPLHQIFEQGNFEKRQLETALASQGLVLVPA